jgi:hypothetical protein
MGEGSLWLYGQLPCVSTCCRLLFKEQYLEITTSLAASTTLYGLGKRLHWQVVKPLPLVVAWCSSICYELSRPARGLHAAANMSQDRQHHYFL